MNRLFLHECWWIERGVNNQREGRNLSSLRLVCCPDLCIMEFVQRPQGISNLAKDSL